LTTDAGDLSAKTKDEEGSPKAVRKEAERANGNFGNG
jgi:hypothetical protein